MDALSMKVGESKSNASQTASSIGDGVLVEGKGASESTPGSAAHLQHLKNSIQTEPHDTDLDIKRKHLENWAQIIADSALEYRNLGGDVRVGNAKGALVIVMPGLFHCEKHGKASVGTACHYCVSSGTESSGTESSGTDKR